MKEWSKALPKAEQIELERALSTNLSIDIEQENHDEMVLIEKMINNKLIADEGDYRLVLDFVEKNYDDEAQKTRINQLNKMLADYHQRKSGSSL